MAASLEIPVASQPRATSFRVLRLFGPYRSRLILTAGLALIGVALGILSPFLVRAVFDRGLFAPSGVNNRLVVELSAAFVLITLIQGLAGLALSYITVVIGQDIVRGLRSDMFKALLRRPLGDVTFARSGDVQSRLQNDVGGVLFFLTSVSPTMITGVMTLIGVLLAMFLLSWPLAVTSLLIVPPFVATSYMTGNRKRVATITRQERFADLTAISQEALSPAGVLQIRAFGRTDEMEMRYSRANSAVTHASVAQWLAGTVQLQGTTTLFAIVPAVGFLTTAYAINHFGYPITAGTLAAFVTLQGRLYWPLANLLQLAVNARSALGFFDRIFEFVDLRPDPILESQATSLDSTLRSLRVRSLTFSRRDSEGKIRPVLIDISFDAGPGDLVAFVGPSGAGKSTLSHVIAGLYKPEAGSVLVNGNEISDLRADARTALVGLASQDVFLFHDTVASNLRFVRPSATDEDIFAATRAAHIHDMISDLRDGYETVVGEGGLAFSTGERQRLALARVVLLDAPIVVLDEVTSALDPENERLVMKTVDELRAKGKIVIAVSHRLNTVREATLILVMENGRIIESGRHEPLMTRDSHYAALIRSGVIDVPPGDEDARGPPGGNALTSETVAPR